jgi:UrcA family protein
MMAGVATIAAAMLAPQAAVMAQSGSEYSATTDRPIIVDAPTARHMQQAERKSVTAQPVLVSQSVVYTGDLDLRTQAGRDELDSRVQTAAERACDRIDQIDPPSALSDGYADCVFGAVHRAQNQIYAAIWNA